MGEVPETVPSKSVLKIHSTPGTSHCPSGHTAATALDSATHLCPQPQDPRALYVACIQQATQLLVCTRGKVTNQAFSASYLYNVVQPLQLSFNTATIRKISRVECQYKRYNNKGTSTNRKALQRQSTHLSPKIWFHRKNLTGKDAQKEILP